MMLKSTSLFRTFLPLRYATFTSRIFVEGLPAEWTHHEIAQRFSLAGTVQKVNLVKNQFGQNTGKAIVTFDQESSAQAA